MSVTEQKAIKAIYFSILGNIGLALVKWTAGFFGHSFALIADAIESTSDIVASLLVLFGLKYSTKPADKNHPYGHGKIEPLVTFLVVGFLVFSAGLIAKESLQNIRQPHVSPEPWTLVILGVVILWKEISYQVMLRKSQQTHSSSLKADAWHHRSDSITSAAAFIGILLALVLGEGYEFMDDLAALFASAFILYNSYLIFRPAFGEVMDEDTYEDLTSLIRKESLKTKGILGTEKCYVRKAGMAYYVDLHIVVDKDLTVQKSHYLSHILKSKLIKLIPELGNVTIHIEPNEYL